MHVPNLTTLSELLDVAGPAGRRSLQFELPKYTSPPLPGALDATPDAFRSDEAVEAARDLDASGLCVGPDANHTACQIAFVPEAGDGAGGAGVILYGGALVDPRGYSPLARALSGRGLPVVVPIFEGDMAFKFGTCESGRLAEARKAFPGVKRWVLAGHSFGGLVAYNDVWAMVRRGEDVDAVGGVVLLASYVRQDLGCGPVDFSGREWDWLPFASVSASEDGVVNATNFEAGQGLLPDGPLAMARVIEGGNHGGFGSYDYSERKTLLSQVDGNATITVEEQRAIAAEVIGQVALLAENIGMEPGSPSKSPTSQPSSEPTKVPTTGPVLEPTETATSGVRFLRGFEASLFVLAGTMLAHWLPVAAGADN